MTMLMPDIARHNPKPAYIQSLLDRAGLTQRAASEALGLAPRTLRNYLARDVSHIPAPYPVQFTLEALAEAASTMPEWITSDKRAQSALRNAGIHRTEQLAAMSVDELRAVPGLTNRAIAVIVRKLGLLRAPLAA